jgi:hypothetical protein
MVPAVEPPSPTQSASVEQSPVPIRHAPQPMDSPGARHIRYMPLDIPQSICELQGVPHVAGGLSADASGTPVLLVPPLPPAPPSPPEPPEAVAPPELAAPPVTVVPPVRVVPPAPVVPPSPVAPPICVDAVVAVTPPLSVTPALPPLPAAVVSLPEPAAPPPPAGASKPGICASGLCWPIPVPWLLQPPANPPATIAVTRHPNLALTTTFLFDMDGAVRILRALSCDGREAEPGVVAARHAHAARSTAGSCGSACTHGRVTFRTARARERAVGPLSRALRCLATGPSPSHEQKSRAQGKAPRATWSKNASVFA